MYQRVLVPLDGSDIAAQAVPYALAVARATGAEVALLEVVDMTPPLWREGELGRGPATGGASSETWRQMREEAEGGAQQRLRRIASSIEKQGVRVTSLVRAGDTATAIVDEAESVPETVIAMATHGRSGIGRWLLGSVTDKVLHTATQPVLTVRARSEGTFSPDALHDVIVPLDGSDAAEAAVPHATALARAMGLNITVLSAFEMNLDFPLRYAPIYAPPGFIAEQGVGAVEDLRQEEQRAQSYIDDIVATFRSEGITNADGFTVQDDPAQAILNVAGSGGESLVVMSSHGHTGMTRWRLGSVADKVIRHGEAPVLVVPMKGQAEATGKSEETAA